MDNNEGRASGSEEADRKRKKGDLGRAEWRYVSRVLGYKSDSHRLTKQAGKRQIREDD